MKNKMLAKNKVEEIRPTHFDLAPFGKAFKKFLTCNGEVRSKLRIDLKQNIRIVKKIFSDQYG